jgi:hypothetical protein
VTGLAARSADPPIAAKPEQIARWIRELGDNDFQARENASRRLWEAGKGAE